jgi:conjugative transfer signal peptidase TraF
VCRNKVPSHVVHNKYHASKRRRAYVIGAMLLSVSAIAFAALNQRHVPLLLWNASASAPLGLYLRTTNMPMELQVGDWVLVQPTPEMQQLIDTRHYLPPHTPMIKQVRAIAGQTICRDGLRLSIDGEHAARALGVDQAGRSMPVWQGCSTLQTGELLLLQPHSRSFDGRYFGALKIAHILARLKPVWTWHGDGAA